MYSPLLESCMGSPLSFELCNEQCMALPSCYWYVTLCNRMGNSNATLHMDVRASITV